MIHLTGVGRQWILLCAICAAALARNLQLGAPPVARRQPDRNADAGASFFARGRGTVIRYTDAGNDCFCHRPANCDSGPSTGHHGLSGRWKTECTTRPGAGIRYGRVAT